MILACWVGRLEQLGYRSCFALFGKGGPFGSLFSLLSLALDRAETQSRSTALSEADVCQIHLNVMAVVFLKPNTSW